MTRIRIKQLSLTQALLVGVLIALVTAIVVPAGLEHLRSTRRAAAHELLRAVMADQHSYFIATGRYTTDLVELGYAAENGALVSRNGHYRVEAQLCPERRVTECVMVIAEARGPQASDGALTLDSRGLRNPPHKW